MKKINIFFILALGLLIACNNNKDQKISTSIDDNALNSISKDSYIEHIKILSSDEFEGRMPFTEGERKTITYIKEQFEKIGLKPGNKESFFQEVPMVEISSTPPKTLKITGEKGDLSLTHLDDFVMGSRRQNDLVEVKNSELVFAGFGIVAPEYNWNDYEGLDVKGKTIVVMVNDPGYYNKDLFKGETMTYYGRWTYKFEEAARQGATGIMIIHDTGAASYGWNVVRSGWSGPQMTLEYEDNGASLAAFEGWFTEESAKKLFALAGVSEAIIEEAKKPGFKAVDLNLKTEAKVENHIKKDVSQNVLAKIEGTKRPEEVIIYTAHWDHLGIGEVAKGDSIYNGAIDNATGIAALFEIAKALQNAEVKPERTILFLAVTAEEQGLLGSEYYASHPIYPLSKTVGNINIDALSAGGLTHDISVVGYGQSELDDYAEEFINAQDRKIAPESNPSAGYFFRSDHFNFAKVGVPALYAGSGSDYVDTSAEAKERRAFFDGTYHTQADEFSAEHWEVSGILENLKFLTNIGYKLSMETTFPKWKEGSEFKEAGETRK
jgi:Zn-dependent M28 family amino/carboxypeptidase